MTSSSWGTDMFQKEFQDKLRGLPDLLRFDRVIDDGVTLGKGGELFCTYEYKGLDPESAGPHALRRAAERMNNALRRCETGWAVHVTQCRERAISYPPAAIMAFPDPVTRAIEQERRNHFVGVNGKHYEGINYITFTYLPPSLAETKAKAMIFEKSEDLKAAEIEPGDEHLNHLKKISKDIMAEVGLDLGNVRQLGAIPVFDEDLHETVLLDEQLSYFHFCVTGIRQNIYLSTKGVLKNIDYKVGSQDFVGGFMPRVGKKFVKVIALMDYPDAVHANVLGVLSTIACEYRWTNRFIFMSDNEAKFKIDRIRKKWRQQIHGFVSEALGTTNPASSNEDASNMADQAKDALTEVNSGAVGYGYATQNIVLMGEDPNLLEKETERVIGALRKKNFVVKEEEFNSVEAYLGSIPGHCRQNIRRPIISTMDFAFMLPLTSLWQGPAHNENGFYKQVYADPDVEVPVLMYTASTGATPFRLSLHVADVGHCLILGATGGGKSTMLELITAQQMRYPRARVYKFEKGYSSFVLCNASGGHYYDILGENEANEFKLAPCRRLETLSDRIWVQDWIETVCLVQDLEMNPKRRATIRKAVTALAEDNPDPNHRTLSHLATKIQDEQIRAIIHEYAAGGAAGGILNGSKDTVEDARYIVFEMEHLMSKKDLHSVPVLLYLFRLIERSLDGSPTMIILDEAWLMLNHALFQEKIDEWLRVLRKANCQVIFASQQPTDVDKSLIRDTIYSACQTKILLPNPDILEQPAIAEVYARMGLTDFQCLLLGKAVKKRDYLYVSEYGRKLFRLALGPVALSFVGASGKEDIKLCRRLMTQYQDGWVEEWLRRRNVNPNVLYGAAA
ncbi:hypothetical protein ACPRNU_13965 [Chromobacterium vaccinii]|uniref:VirB4 family type IV secretion/conjugal transfer ATPase n=1 Tax=Chromobacterium vaccinii TaxID=1108595 RepID=UPI003C756ACA